MSDLRTLHDAFAELERRADAAGTAPAVRPRRAARLVPIAATVVAVAGLVAGAVWLVPVDSGTHTAGSLTGSSSTAPSTTPTRSPLPTSPDELIARFTVVLGDTATFEATQRITLPPPSSTNAPQPGAGSGVTPPPADTNASTSALVAGTLTSAGVTGSFSLTIYPGDPDAGESCALLRTEDRDVTTLPDGSRLATGTARPDPGAVSHQACLTRPDGTTILMHVGNQEDPQGAAINSPGGAIYAPQPPLALDQLKVIVTSDKW
ncbi:hypothetical protein [Saccharothrix sp. NRRL B-16314]|uniref:hypothetical protein n=1 Tax=Saccharothrix sp. NRRL B-16314 TaxID=1463825 RepID=UPI000527EAFD|nr:hypothetical protein [Saccharothrix sp. NRRL B-16314]